MELAVVDSDGALRTGGVVAGFACLKDYLCYNTGFDIIDFRISYLLASLLGILITFVNNFNFNLVVMFVCL